MADGTVTNVSTPCNDYKASLNAWTLVEDAVNGSEAVKNATVKYLPKPNPKDISEENRSRYEAYVMRAVYYNATGRTLSGLLGIAFRRDPEVKIPPGIEYIKDDADGAGISLVHKGQQLLANVMKTGRSAILVDYPVTDGVTSKADLILKGIRPVLCTYEANDVINWRTIRENAKTLLSMVVLRESYPLEDPWVETLKTQYRVLRLTLGVYTTEIWREDPNRPGEWKLAEGPMVPTKGDGTSWSEIPFTFIGAEDNDVDVDGSPLYDLAVLNLAHYRNSADYEDSAYFVGQPQIYVAGLSEAWKTDMEKKGLYVGSRSVLALPVGGSAGVLQVTPNTLARQAMVDKEVQMAALGARLLIAPEGAKTATQQNSEDASAHSVLTLCCNNISTALSKALTWFAQFANENDSDISFTINTEFVVDSLDAPTLIALLQLVQAGKMPDTDLWTQLRNVGLIDATKTDDQIREEVASQAPSGIEGAFTPPPNADGTPSREPTEPPTKPGGASSSSSGNGGPNILSSQAVTGNVPRAAVGG